jgi:hypothetical protein
MMPRSELVFLTFNVI